MSFAVTRSLRSLRSGELNALRVPAEPAPSAVPSCRQPTGAGFAGACVRRVYILQPEGGVSL